MAIKRSTSNAAIAQYLSSEIAKRERALVHSVRYAGEKAIAEARTNGNYRDRTGNLRASVGYMLLQEGKPVGEAGFTGRGADGAQKGKAFCQRIARNFRRGIALVLAAGMPYAHDVSVRGYNVLDSAELEAERDMQSLGKRLGGK